MLRFASRIERMTKTESPHILEISFERLELDSNETGDVFRTLRFCLSRGQREVSCPPRVVSGAVSEWWDTPPLGLQMTLWLDKKAAVAGGGTAVTSSSYMSKEYILDLKQTISTAHFSIATFTIDAANYVGEGGPNMEGKKVRLYAPELKGLSGTASVHCRIRCYEVPVTDAISEGSSPRAMEGTSTFAQGSLGNGHADVASPPPPAAGEAGQNGTTTGHRLSLLRLSSRGSMYGDTKDVNSSTVTTPGTTTSTDSNRTVAFDSMRLPQEELLRQHQELLPPHLHEQQSPTQQQPLIRHARHATHHQLTQQAAAASQVSSPLNRLSFTSTTTTTAFKTSNIGGDVSSSSQFKNPFAAKRQISRSVSPSRHSRAKSNFVNFVEPPPGLEGLGGGSGRGGVYDNGGGSGEMEGEMTRDTAMKAKSDVAAGLRRSSTGRDGTVDGVNLREKRLWETRLAMIENQLEHALKENIQLKTDLSSSQRKQRYMEVEIAQSNAAIEELEEFKARINQEAQLRDEQKRQEVIVEHNHGSRLRSELTEAVSLLELCAVRMCELERTLLTYKREIPADAYREMKACIDVACKEIA